VDAKSGERSSCRGAYAQFDTISFHAQQCGEKYLKALLVLHSVPFPKSHDLSEIMALLPKHLMLNVKKSELSILSRYAVETHYPGGFEPISRKDAKEAIAIALKIRAEVSLYLPKEVNNK